MSSQTAASADKPPAEGKGGSGAPETKDEEEFKPAKPPPQPKTEPKYYVHSKKFLDVFVIVSAVFTLGISRWFRPGFWSTIIYALVGLPIGIGLSFLFYLRSKNKAKLTQLVRHHSCATLSLTVHLAHCCNCWVLNLVLSSPHLMHGSCACLASRVYACAEQIVPCGSAVLPFTHCARMLMRAGSCTLRAR